MKKETTFYDSKEETLNVITHGIGFVLSIIALVVLLVSASKNGSQP